MSEFVDCTCGHPNADHNFGECPFPGCMCGWTWCDEDCDEDCMTDHKGEQ